MPSVQDSSWPGPCCSSGLLSHFHRSTRHPNHYALPLVHSRHCAASKLRIFARVFQPLRHTSLSLPSEPTIVPPSYSAPSFSFARSQPHCHLLQGHPLLCPPHMALQHPPSPITALLTPCCAVSSPFPHTPHLPSVRVATSPALFPAVECSTFTKC